jgi:hypothetical protein
MSPILWLVQATVSATVDRKDAELAALRRQLEEAQQVAEVGWGPCHCRQCWLSGWQHVLWHCGDQRCLSLGH